MESLYTEPLSTEPMDLRITQGIQSNQPLYNRVPTRDAEGNPLTDFMILVLGFRGWPKARQVAAIEKMQMGDYDGLISHTTIVMIRYSPVAGQFVPCLY